MIGEHLWLGNIGKFLLLLSFFMALFSGIVYSISTRLKLQDEISRFQKAGKVGFLFHAGSMIMASSPGWIIAVMTQKMASVAPAVTVISVFGS